MGRLFGTDGIRGTAGNELTAEMAFRLGLAVAEVLTEQKESKPVVIIGKDTRLSGDMFEAAISAGLCAMGSDVYTAGVVPTPAVAFLVKDMNADAGIMISASHNPSEYNGIKVFNGEGYKLSDELEEKVEVIILNEVEIKPICGQRIGRVHSASGYIGRYINHIKSILDTCKGGDFGKRKILFDLSNGSAVTTAKSIFSCETLGGCLTDFIDFDPDGVNINESCGSTHISKLAEQTVKGGYDLGFAFDGDADRCLMCDETGNVIDGDMIIARLAMEMKKDGTLREDRAVVTKLTNLGFHIMMKKLGIDVGVTDVGDRYVLEEMLRSGSNIGGEQSGHIILSDYATTGDGQITAAKVLSVIAGYPGQKVSEIFGVMRKLPQISVNVKVPNPLKKMIMENGRVKAGVKKISDMLGENGRILLRPSGTEAMIRIMLEGEEEDKLLSYAKEIQYLIEDLI